MKDFVKKHKYSIFMAVALTVFNVLMAIMHSAEGDDITLPFILSVGVTVVGAFAAYILVDKPEMKEKQGLN